MQRKLAALGKLLDVIDRLRGPGGCPWDRAQTLENMKRYLLEETCETIDAIEEAEGRPEGSVCEELGDVLMNVVLASRIAEDAGGFDVADVASGIAEKLVRRHPHVFGDRKVDSVDEVLTNWNAIKDQERTVAASRLDGVPRSLPALERAHQLGRRAAKAGFDWPDAAGAFEKIVEETEEVRVLLREAAEHPEGEASPIDARPPEAGGPQDRQSEARFQIEAELGDLLFAVTNLCRKLGVAPEKALRRTLRKFCDRFRAIERRFPTMEGIPLEEMEAVWQEAKGRGYAGEEGA
jgi:MazG family protein